MDLQLGLFSDDQLPAAPPAVGPVASSVELSRIARALPSGLRLGTSSWSFPGWEGIVYDRRTSQSVLAREGLAAYASHPLFRTVGLDRTYYRPLPAQELASYADAVPPDFRLLVKADRVLTSPLDPEALGLRRVNERFLDPEHAIRAVVMPVVEGLGEKAGPLLFQFPPIPPNLVGGRGAFLERLGRFLGALPEGPLYAVELRTPAFLTSDYAEVLDRHGVAHCYNVHPAMAPLDRQLEVVSATYQPALVVRWMLHAGLRYEAARDRYEPFDQMMDPDPTTRERIALAVLDCSIAERNAFVIANNKAEGSAPLTVTELAKRVADWSPEEGPPLSAPAPEAPR